MKAKAKTSKTGGAKAALDNGAALAVVPAEVYKWLEGVADKANATPGEFAAAIVGAFHKLVTEWRATGKTDLPTTRGSLERQDYPEHERKERPSTGMKKEDK